MLQQRSRWHQGNSAGTHSHRQDADGWGGSTPLQSGVVRANQDQEEEKAEEPLPRVRLSQNDFQKAVAVPSPTRAGSRSCPAPYLQAADDFPERKSRLVSSDESGCGQVEDLVEVRFIQPVKACRIFMGGTSESKREKERRGTGGVLDTATRHPGVFRRGGEGTKSSTKPKISMKVYMDKNQAVIKQKTLSTRLLRKAMQGTKHKAIYVHVNW